MDRKRQILINDGYTSDLIDHMTESQINADVKKISRKISQSFECAITLARRSVVKELCSDYNITNLNSKMAEFLARIFARPIREKDIENTIRRQEYFLSAQNEVGCVASSGIRKNDINGSALQRDSQAHLQTKNAPENGAAGIAELDSPGQKDCVLNQREAVEDYIEVFDKEIEGKDEEIHRLNNDLSRFQEVSRGNEKKLRNEIRKAQKGTIQEMFSNLELVRDSWEVLLQDISNRKNILKILQEFQITPMSSRGKRVESTKCWRELHYGTGNSNDGRLYYKQDGQISKVLLSFKGKQSSDIRWLKKN